MTKERQMTKRPEALVPASRAPLRQRDAGAADRALLPMAIVLALAAVSASCADADPPTTTMVTVNVADAPLWSVESSFEVEQDEDEPLGKVTGAILPSPNLIAIADGLNYRVVVTDSLGRRLRTVGRAGMGPLEFEALDWMARWPGDSVFVWDSGSRRYSVFSPETGEGRTVLPQGMETPVARALPSDGEGLWVMGVALVAGDTMPRGPARFRHDVGYWQGTGRVTKVHSLAAGGYVKQGGRVLQWLEGPTTAMATGNGLFYFTEGERPTVAVLDPTGVVLREINVHGLAVQLTDARRQKLVERLHESYGVAAVDRLLDAAPLPEQFDAIQQIVFGRDGTLWLGQRPTPDMERIWLNVTTEGEPIRQVAMPAKDGVMLDAAGDRLLFLTRDKLDLDYIHVHVIAAG